MTPLPKRKLSTRRQGKRRARHGFEIKTLGKCPHCGQPAIAHRICPHCGYYQGRLIRTPKEKKKRL